MSNSFYDTTSASNTITLVTSTADVTSTTNLNDTDSVWFPYYMESTWLPYHSTPYNPEWHIKKGYKNQIETMWD